MKKKVFTVFAVCLLCVGLSQTAFAAQGGQGGITMEAAQKIALDHAKADAASVTFMEMELDHDHGVAEYEIAFMWNNLWYEYEIDAASGAVTSYSQKMSKQARRANAAAANPGSDIGIDAAKEIALKHAGVAANQASFTKVKLDRDRKRGSAEYELKFSAGGKRYEYEIDASSGKILEYSVKNRAKRR